MTDFTRRPARPRIMAYPEPWDMNDEMYGRLVGLCGVSVHAPTFPRDAPTNGGCGKTVREKLSTLICNNPPEWWHITCWRTESDRRETHDRND